MRLSARNIIKGKILEVKRGATTAHVKIDVGGGTVITSSITNEAVDELGLKAGDPAYAVIKASDVMVAKDSARRSAAFPTTAETSPESARSAVAPLSPHGVARVSPW